MKLPNKIKIISGVLLTSLCCLTASCDFLEIVPVEQPKLDDATQDYNSTLGFLHSCYAGILNPVNYTEVEQSADEFAIPLEYNREGYKALKVAHDLMTASTDEGRWGTYYRYIGQVHLFLQELEKAPVSKKEKVQWAAEANFLLAYYHFELLRFYGPIPINDKLAPLDISPDQYSGRMHYDYVTNWIVKLLDEKVLPQGKLENTRLDHEISRVTRPIALALKARVLLYAASPLWNGEFPYPDWKNEKRGKIMETPGYGSALISTTYDRQKWIAAEAACKEALQAALDAGHYLFGTRAGDDQLQLQAKLEMHYVPGLTGTADQKKAFQNKILTLRYMMTAKGNQGNKEFVWQLNKDNNFIYASMPNAILTYNDGKEYSGWSAVSPYLYSIEHFYTQEGEVPEVAADLGTYTSKSKWLERSGVDQSRPDIINLCVGREPRFYAWMVFDQGDYTCKFDNGNPVRIEMKNKDKQGYNPTKYNRNHLVTGFAMQKFIDPELFQDHVSYAGIPQKCRPLIRMAELYLNLAECQAMLSSDKKSDQFALDALANLNAVHERAGLDPIKVSDLDNLPLIEWIKNERFVELWGEGHRYFDIRRWVEGPKYLAAGKREGLNAEKITNPSFADFNQRIKVNQPYRWNNRQYLIPIYYDEVNCNPQLVQAPGY